MQSIWKYRDLWPLARREFVFLVEAFDEVGAALFGPEWTGQEALQVLPAGGSLFGLTAPVHVNAMICTSLARRDKVAAWIADQGLNHGLQTFARPVGMPGDPDLAPSAVWSVDPPLWPFFEGCQTRLAFGQFIHPSWIFLGRESLDQRLASIEAPAVEKEPHPSSLAAKDAPIVEDMRAAIVAREYSGPAAASIQFAAAAAGEGELLNKAKRLERRYIAKYGR